MKIPTRLAALIVAEKLTAQGMDLIGGIKAGD